MTISTSLFGTTKSGQDIDLITISNDSFSVELINFGATIKSIKTKDNNDRFVDTVLGFDTLAEYEKNDPYIGVTVGRFANRVAKGQFEIDGETYQLPINNGPNALHGGLEGFSHKVWSIEILDENSVKMNYFSKDGEEGYPGNLNVSVTFSVVDETSLKIDYSATTDKSTIINLTNHTYFNLNGSGSILDHNLKINAESFLPTDDTNIPTGEIRSVSNTPFDFTTVKPIGQDIAVENTQLQYGNGYDHNYIISGKIDEVAVESFSEESGIKMETFTTEPGVQLYTGNYLLDTYGKNGQIYANRTGFCVETQHWPDSPNKPEFPTTVLKPEETFKSTTIYRFSTL